MMQIIRPRLEALREPIGVDEPNPRFSWQLRSNDRLAAQSAYSITVWRGDELVWYTGKTPGKQCAQIEYAGTPLVPRTKYQWQARVWDEKGVDAGQSRTAFFETGLMGNWRARFIAPKTRYSPGRTLPVTRFSRAIEVRGAISRARIYVSALGVYALLINGARAHDCRLPPGQTSTQGRVRYQAMDITGLIRPGANRIDIDVAGGYYTGEYAYSLCPEKCAERVQVIAQTYIEYTDGTEDVICTDSKWTCDQSGPYRAADIIMGVDYDATREFSAPTPVEISEASPKLLRWQAAPKVLFREELPARAIFKTPSGETIVDFGQNAAGVVRFRVRGERGRRVSYDCCEALDKNGEFYRENYRSARSEIRYTLSGGGETFTPDFTYSGLRYIRLKNWPDDAAPADFTLLVMRSDVEECAGFECSDERVNQLYQNIVWTLKSNMVGILTDAPERDERFGWTGNYRALSRPVAMLFDAEAMLYDWLDDVEIEQKPNGAIPSIIPNGLKDELYGEALNDDALVVIPWALYFCYGSVRALERHYELIKRWVKYVSNQVKDGLWATDYQYGDWLALDARHNSLIGTTDVTLIATAAYARATELAARIADALERDIDAKMFAALNKKITKAFRREFITATGRLANNTQTAYILTLQFDLCEEEHRDRIIRDMSRLFDDSGENLTTGSAGTPFALTLLTASGLHDTAGRIFFNDGAPGYLYSVKRGATSIWERWDAVREDGGFINPEFNSLNHVSRAGGAAEWLLRCVAGINNHRVPMYEELMLHPRVTEGLTFASGRMRTPFGTVSCGWRVRDDKVSVDARVPVSCEAMVVLENARLADVRCSGAKLADTEGVSRAWQTENDVFVKVGSGEYEFEWRI